MTDLASGARDPGLSPSIADPGRLEASRVVVVDDNPANVALLKRLLTLAGVDGAEGFTDGRLALERCVGSLPDLLLLDLRMPGLDGFAVMEGLRSAIPAGEFLPVLVLTADDTTETKQRALAAGAKDFLTKPFDATEVVLRVRNLLETKDLYNQLQRHNAQLQAELDEQLACERWQAEELERCAARVAEVLDASRLTIAFQPIVGVVDGRLIGAEALTRFQAEPRRPPNEWFAEAALVGRGVELEMKALDCALGLLEELPGHVYMSINASPAAAVTPGLSAMVSSVRGDRVVLELTEHTHVQDYGPLLAALDRPRAHGVRVAVDDTGAGYAGLQHLLRLQPDVIKLDIALTRSIDTDPARRSLAAALVMFANEIGAVIIAEGVETAAELHALRALGVGAAQGFWLGRPGPASALRTDYSDLFSDRG